MQIIIPMSGFGERFRKAGFAVPKPLIEVDGKPMIGHVVDMFGKNHDFIFICNRDHLLEQSFRMADILREICPNGKIVPVDAHKLGPVHAVLSAKEHINLQGPVVVNYCDFSCYWDFEDFKRFVAETGSDGCIPAYRGFHPHSLGSTHYAYMREEGLWMQDIQEKKPFTDKPMNEYASSGTYYFKSGQLCVDLFEEQMTSDLSVNGEFYVSLAYKKLLERGGKVSVYELQHFMQWGTPEDLAEYKDWSKTFRTLAASDGRRARHRGAVLLPMAGLGKRFADEGYDKPKPLVPVSGRPMVIQALRDLPDTPLQKFVLRADLPGVDQIEKKLRATFVGAQFKILERLTEGQAITCLEGIDGLDLDAPVTIGACDNGVLYNVDAFERAFAEGGADVLVWTIRGHADGRRRPEMFGWVDQGPDGAVTGVRVKSAPDSPTSDPMIIGAFTFRRARDFVDAANALVARDARVNGEFYVDSLVEDALSAGLRVAIFEVDAYIGWGTPTDLKTFQYWQACFHKWASHPYRLERDKRVPAVAVRDLQKTYAPLIPARPAGTAGSSGLMDDGVKETLGQALRFVPIGFATVGLDFVAYQLLLMLGLDVTVSKTVSFLAGAVFAFFANRTFTFRAAGGASALFKFALVYLTSLLVNVTVNGVALAALKGLLPMAAGLLIAWFIATGTSAAVNFFGMKFYVFRK